MSHLGDRAPGSTIVLDFTTAVDGVPTALGGSAAISVYKNSVTQSTAGVTLTTSYDGIAGFNRAVIDTSADESFYAEDNDFSVVLTTGTVGGKSVVGYVVGTFRLAGSDSGPDIAAIRDVTDQLAHTVFAIARGTATASGSSNTAIATSAFSMGVGAEDQFAGRVALFDGDTTTAALRGVAVQISASSNSSTPTLTVDAMPAIPANGDTFSIV